MKYLMVGVVSLVANVPSGATAKDTPWRKDPQHPQLQYRVTCSKGAGTVDWRNGYPGDVKLRASIKSPSYDGTEDVKVPGHALTHTNLETMSCTPSSIRVKLIQFTMAAAPGPPPPPPADSAKPRPPATKSDPTPPPAPPALVRFDPTAGKYPEITLEALGEIKVGMNQRQVVQKLGPPASKLTIPEDDRIIETYGYRVVDSATAIVRFSNGAVVAVTPPR
jgi:hypothetical protein